MRETEQLAELIRDTTYDSLNEDVRFVARGAVMDGIANMLAGSREPLARVLMDHLTRFGGTPDATVVGHAHRADPFNAAFANGVFCHSMDFELMWYPPTHPTGPTLPAILALSEMRPVSGKEALAALVAGFEVQGQLNWAVFSTGRRWPNGMHPPGFFGVFGAAATSARILGLDVEQTRNALGISASRSAGLMVNTGTMTKSSHSGHSARTGMEAALLAEVGYTGAADALEGVHGFNEVFFQNEMDLASVVSSYGKPFRMVDPGVVVKKHPTQFPTHWSIDAALEIRAGGVDPADIEHVEVEVGADNESARVERPANGLGGKFSVSYTVAAALLDGVVRIDTFRDERHAAPDLQAMLERITITRNESVRAMDFANAWSKVTVTLRDGQTRTARVDRPLGVWDNPLPWEMWVDKYRQCAHRAVSEQRATEILDRIENFDQLTDLGRDLVPLLAAD